MHAKGWGFPLQNIPVSCRSYQIVVCNDVNMAKVNIGMCNAIEARGLCVLLAGLSVVGWAERVGGGGGITSCSLWITQMYSYSKVRTTSKNIRQDKFSHRSHADSFPTL